MSLFKEIKDMVGKRLAYKLWLVKDEFNMLVFTDRRYLTFIRLMMLFFTFFPIGVLALIHNKQKDIPLPVYLILGFFAFVFFLTFLLKSTNHKEVVLDSQAKKITVSKKRFNTVLSEDQFGFDQIKKINLQRVSYKDRRDYHGTRTRTNFEILMKLKDDFELHFSTINSPDSALETGNKIAEFVNMELTSLI